ncbi:hypothetical protein BDN72DRAFT_857404 [Pluteus cervinus]|uniref:Uncharacterized protein n=1 Tax=Pluteus cervinus TaxID=181527 RepID=A0ACD3AW08_9AGAR|nr:hypothetical protein BDN72DRAFT_857404 [Pluteus cervinus]
MIRQAGKESQKKEEEYEVNEERGVTSSNRAVKSLLEESWRQRWVLLSSAFNGIACWREMEEEKEWERTAREDNQLRTWAGTSKFDYDHRNIRHLTLGLEIIDTAEAATATVEAPKPVDPHVAEPTLVETMLRTLNRRYPSQLDNVDTTAKSCSLFYKMLIYVLSMPILITSRCELFQTWISFNDLVSTVKRYGQVM